SPSRYTVMRNVPSRSLWHLISTSSHSLRWSSSSSSSRVGPLIPDSMRSVTTSPTRSGAGSGGAARLRRGGQHCWRWSRSAWGGRPGGRGSGLPSRCVSLRCSLRVTCKPVIGDVVTSARAAVQVVSLHQLTVDHLDEPRLGRVPWQAVGVEPTQDRKSTRLNSSHVKISYAVFCLKKKNLY